MNTAEDLPLYNASKESIRQTADKGKSDAVPDINCRVSTRDMARLGLAIRIGCLVGSYSGYFL